LKEVLKLVWKDNIKCSSYHNAIRNLKKTIFKNKVRSFSMGCVESNPHLMKRIFNSHNISLRDGEDDPLPPEQEPLQPQNGEKDHDEEVEEETEEKDKESILQPNGNEPNASQEKSTTEKKAVRKNKEVKMVVVTSENEKELEIMGGQLDNKLETIQESDASSDHSDREPGGKKRGLEKLTTKGDRFSRNCMLFPQAKLDDMRNHLTVERDDKHKTTEGEEDEDESDDNHTALDKKNRLRRLIRDDSEIGARQIRLAQKSIGRYIEREKKRKQEEQTQSKKQEEMLLGEFEEITPDTTSSKAYRYSLFDK